MRCRHALHGIQGLMSDLLWPSFLLIRKISVSPRDKGREFVSIGEHDIVYSLFESHHLQTLYI
jgi:hypothetical protein